MDEAAKVEAGSEGAQAPSIALASNCSVKDAAQLKQLLCEHAGAPQTVTLDARAVERIDTAALQLLCAFVRDRSARQQAVAWLGASQQLLEAARLLGIAELLALSSQSQAAAEVAA